MNKEKKLFKTTFLIIIICVLASENKVMGIAGFFEDLWSGTKDIVGKVVNSTKEVLQGAVEKTKSFANTVYEKGEGVVNWAGRQIDKVTDIPSDLTKSLTSPLVWVAAGVAAIILLKGKGMG